MEIDFYKLLGISVNATEAEITKAYRKSALRCHPDKNNTPHAEESFKLLSQAYDVLKDRRKRVEYDKRYAAWSRFWSGIWTQVPPVYPKKYAYTPGYYTHYEPRCYPTTVNTPYAKRVKDPLIERDVSITLENVLNGVAKKVKITKQVLNPDGVSTRTENNILTLNIKPGCEEGTRILFPREGDQTRFNSPADVVFTLKYKPHMLFERDNSDIRYTCQLSMQQVLNKEFEIPTLDGDRIWVKMNENEKYPHERVFEGRGLPNPKNFNKRGNLIVTIEVPKDLETNLC